MKQLNSKSFLLSLLFYQLNLENKNIRNSNFKYSISEADLKVNMIK